MSQNWTESARRLLPKRVLLLLTARTYRAESFITAADRLGIEVVKAIDMQKALADHWRFPLGLDYSKEEESAEKIIEFSRNKPIGAILSVDDSGSMIASLASQALNIPHNSPQASLAARDKYIMRQQLHASGIPAPISTKYIISTSNPTKDLELVAEMTSYPCVLKPINLSGSRGVIRADNPKQFVAAGRRLVAILAELDPHNELGSILVESYVPGVEVAVEGLMNNGHFQPLAIFDKPDPLEGPFFEETLYITPSRLPSKDQEAIMQCTAAAALALGLHEGSIHAELRYNEQGPWVIELAGRSIGGLCSHTLRFAGKASLEELILCQAFGLEVQSYQQEYEAGGVMMIPIPQEGLLKAVYGCEAAAATPLIESVKITARENYVLRPLPEGDSYLGFIFAFGNDPANVEQSLRTAHGKLSFEIAPLLPLL